MLKMKPDLHKSYCGEHCPGITQNEYMYMSLYKPPKDGLFYIYYRSVYNTWKRSILIKKDNNVTLVDFSNAKPSP